MPHPEGKRAQGGLPREARDRRARVGDGGRVQTSGWPARSNASSARRALAFLIIAGARGGRDAAARHLPTETLPAEAVALCCTGGRGGFQTRPDADKGTDGPGMVKAEMWHRP